MNSIYKIIVSVTILLLFSIKLAGCQSGEADANTVDSAMKVGVFNERLNSVYADRDLVLLPELGVVELLTVEKGEDHDLIASEENQEVIDHSNSDSLASEEVETQIDHTTVTIEEPEEETAQVAVKEKALPNIKIGGLDMVNYRLPSKNSRAREESVTHVMLHFISNVARNTADPFNIKDIHNIFVEYGVSAHYMIDREGVIYFLVPEDRVAYHAGRGSLPDFPEYENDLNEYSIGIELLAIGTKSEMASIMTGDLYDQVDSSLIGYTNAQYEALNRLLNGIYDRHPNVQRDRKHVVGHDEYAPGRKSDPGSLFDWSKIGY
ncbi:N-acetylmuramoyl-L-alanine amidase [Bacillus alkalicola]|uniref:N-acetylmuramoyl-L-alanine amidase n=1 Tax=Evansella alkalicola TaxID=745819 RepID=UPI002FF4CAF0